MFDDFHDPDPPSADVARLAIVAERAATRRRRRNAVGGSIAVVGLVAVGAISTTLANDGDADLLVTATDPSVSAPVPSTTNVNSPGTTTPPATTPPGATTTSPVGSDPAIDTPTLLSRELPRCVGKDEPLRCPTFGTLADGTLIALTADDENTVLSFTTVDSDFTLDPRFDGTQPELLHVGPGDIGYVSWIPDGPSDGVPARRLSAVDLRGPDAGQVVADFDAIIDGSGDTRYVAAREGLVAADCCTLGLNPAPDAPVVASWVGADGDQSALVGERGFTIDLSTTELIVRETGEEYSREWTLPAPEGLPFMPRIYGTHGGDATYVFEPLHAGRTRDVPIRLLNDGTVDIGEAVDGWIAHVLDDGRLIVRQNGSTGFEVVTPTSAVSEPPVGEVPTTDDTVSPAEPQTPPLTRPIVAIEADGDAVFIPATSSSLTPVLLYDGPDRLDVTPEVGDGPNEVSFVSVSPDESSAYIWLCCSPAVGTVLATRPPAPARTADTPTYGSAPVFDPSGTYEAVSAIESGIAVGIAGSDERTSLGIDGIGFDATWDVMWFDETTVIVLGSSGRQWTLSAFDVEATDGASVTVVERFSRPFAGFDGEGSVGFGDLDFAGHPSQGEIAVHDPGSDKVWSGTLDDFGNNNGDESGSSLRAVDLPGQARSAWFAGGDELVWVDVGGTLRAGDLVVPGEYRWARR